jgi:cytochrome b pre-mRNA-processing protein 3
MSQFFKRDFTDMSFLQKLFGAKDQDPRTALRPLYHSIISKGRELHWYETGQVADTLDGRFDMISSILSIVLLRLEQLPTAGQDSAYLTEVFVEDMDAQMREAGIGDVTVAKDIGKIMSVLGGRLGAFRGSFDEPEKLKQAIIRNIFEGTAPAGSAQNHLETELNKFWQQLQHVSHDDLLAGKLA